MSLECILSILSRRWPTTNAPQSLFNFQYSPSAGASILVGGTYYVAFSKILFYVTSKPNILKGGLDMEKTIAEIIDMAIQREDAAYDF